MRTLLGGSVVSLVVLGCGSTPAPTPARDGDAVAVHLQGVVVRQYRGAEKRFEVRAAHMQVQEQSERLDARGGVQGVLEPALWEEKE